MTISTDRAALWKVIAGATLLIGILDISDAFIFYGLRGVTPTRILQGIASGVLGRAAFGMGYRSALLGLFFHFFIAFSAAAVFLLASRKLPLARHPSLYGALFGIALYIVMNYVVLPLSKIGPRPAPPLVPFINGVAALVVCIGIPLAFIARRYVAQQTS
ncbi:MAG TPA: hypothetical protein VHW70_14975 [Edaphobacter sp.]|jgi:hypothetical protein|nr:hypothetical protein [Edaphobacter sp.]